MPHATQVTQQPEKVVGTLSPMHVRLPIRTTKANCQPWYALGIFNNHFPFLMPRDRPGTPTPSTYIDNVELTCETDHPRTCAIHSSSILILCHCWHLKKIMETRWPIRRQLYPHLHSLQSGSSSSTSVAPPLSLPSNPVP
jgi:hypothetical protein